MRVFLFTATVFLSASLLFVVEPMIGKMILPVLGGTPAVWNTCLVFFQIMLLLGYAYVHVMTRVLQPRGQALLHALVLSTAIFCLPLSIRAGTAPPTHSNPIGWLLVVLAISIGLPFAIVSATAPLVQKWFAYSAPDGNEKGRDPYFLYAASNVGSMIALLSYPVAIEPVFAIPFQRVAWSIGYALLAVMLVLCGMIVWWKRAKSQSSDRAVVDKGAIVSRSDRLWWLVLSAVPSSYLLGVTTYLTSDIAAVPLLWVLPLTLYLLSFSIAFSRFAPSRKFLAIAAPIAIVLTTISMLSNVSQPIRIALPLHLITFFLASLACNGELSRRRPSTTHLTEYYLLISIGGVIGGLFNALLAPMIFKSALEYPMALAAACMLLPKRDQKRPKLAITIELPIVAGGMMLTMLVAMRGREIAAATYVLLSAIPVLICFAARKHPVRFGLCIGAVLAVGMIDLSGTTVLKARSFFGIHRLVRTNSPPFNVLYHGSTLHGQQMIDSVTRQPIHADVPLTYYTRSGPIGQVFEMLQTESKPHSRVAAIGLGAGALAAYANPGTELRFYEIDPKVVQIAENTDCFTYLSAARLRGAKVDIVLGDARLTLRDAPLSSVDLLILDAFSGDSIPVHLLTREALAMYLTKLSPHGVMAFHVSNLYLSLQPVLATLAADAGIRCYSSRDVKREPGDVASGKLASEWVVLVRDDGDFDSLAHDSRWTPLTAADSRTLWTDDFTNIFAVLRR